jgi:RNase P/RNase MRP subunit p29
MDGLKTRACGYCNAVRVWNWNGQKMKDGSKVYLDENGNRWAGRRCPVCEKSRVAAAVRHDSFDRAMIFQQLTDKGFVIKSKTHPVMVEKDGQAFQVGIRRARTVDGSILIESPADARDDIVALVFESVRLCTPEQIKGVNVFEPQPETQKPNQILSGHSLPSRSGAESAL